MSRDEQLKERWEFLVKKLSAQFSDGDPLELDGIVYLVGVQELGDFMAIMILIFSMKTDGRTIPSRNNCRH